MKPIWYAILIVAILLGGIIFFQILPVVTDLIVETTTYMFVGINREAITMMIDLGSPVWVINLTLFLWWTLVILFGLLIVVASFHKGR